MKPLRILTYNHHESYIALMAKTGFTFDVITRRGKLDLGWQKDRIEVPDNVNLVEFGENVKERLRDGMYDVVVCHTIMNLIWFWPYLSNRFIFIAHIPLYRYSPLFWAKSLAKSLVLKTFQMFHKCRFVAIAKLKQQTWRAEGRIIHPTVNQFPQIDSNKPHAKVVMVCNHLKQRGEELGWPLVEKIMRDVPVTVVGLNPGIDSSVRLSSFAEFQSFLQGYKIYLYTIEQPYGDGFNLALLEAMSMGMVPVTIANSSSPVRHGKNGLVGKDADELISHLKELQADPDKVRLLGEEARKTVANEFSNQKFIESWREELILAAEK